MEYKDYYQILGLEKTATLEQIKKRYRILARKYHPDVSKEKDAEEKFKQVKEAYEVLKDPKKRKAYDQLGSQWRAGEQFKPPPGWQWDFQQPAGGVEGEGSTGFGDFSDFFENLFGQGVRSRTWQRAYSQKGQDLQSKIIISLEEAFAGTQRVIQLQDPVLDPGTGRIVNKTRNLKIKIPAGVIAGQQIRLAGQGGKGQGAGKPGDLYLEIQLSEHPWFTLKNRDIYLNLPVTPWEAALGSKISIPTLGGKVELTIPPHSQTGSQLRLRNRGLPGSPPGDQYVVLTIYTPEPKTEEQQQLYRQMAQVMPFNPRADHFGSSI